MAPVLAQTAAIFLALLFAAAAEHKLRALRRFASLLGEYLSLPPRAALTLATVLGASEAVLAVALPLWPAPAGLVAALLLAIYLAAMAAQLARGRRNLDCGCIGAAGRQPLRPWLLARNAVLIVLALFARAAGAAPASAAGTALALAAGAALFLLALAAAQLPLNHERLYAGGSSR